MWPPTVVVGVGAVFGKDTPQLPLAEDQDAVGEFGSGRKYESFGEAVRSRASRWDLHGVDARTGQGSVERRGELTGPVADEEAECGGSVVEVRQEVPGLLGGPRSGEVMAQSTWKKSTAGIVEACLRRNRGHVVSLGRDGAGGIARSLRTLRIVGVPTRCPSSSSSSWRRW
jgi:hypothetical protein